MIFLIPDSTVLTVGFSGTLAGLASLTSSLIILFKDSLIANHPDYEEKKLIVNLNSDRVSLRKFRHSVGQSFHFSAVVEVSGVSSVQPHVVGGAVGVVADLSQRDADASALVA